MGVHPLPCPTVTARVGSPGSALRQQRPREPQALSSTREAVTAPTGLWLRLGVSSGVQCVWEADGPGDSHMLTANRAGQGAGAHSVRPAARMAPDRRAPGG